MGYVRRSNKFIDPAGVKNAYEWVINQSSEESVQNSRQMGDGAPSNDYGLIPQQGSDYPLVFQWKGTLFTQADKDEMDSWYALCRDQTIHLHDFDQNHYEILITDWGVQRVPVAWNRRGQVPWLWNYTIVIRVLNVLSGDWTNAVANPGGD